MAEDDSGDAYDQAVSSGDDGNDNERRVTTTRSYFPSPTDLYQSVSWRSPIYLLCYLPFVYILSLLLGGLPNEERSSTRKEDEGFKSEDLSIIAQELDSAKQSHHQARTKSRSVRKRLELMNQRRLIRESNNTYGQNSISSIAQEQQQGDQRVVEMARARLQRDAGRNRLSGNEVRLGKLI